MYEQKKTVGPIIQAERAEWKSPELRRLDAGRAEIGPSNRTDGLNTAS
jgi:hypothetical protein